MAKFELPDSVFDKEIVAGSVDKAAKSAGAKAAGEMAGKLFHVPIDNIRVIDGYNVRIRTPDYEKHLRNIADSMKANGYDPAKPLAAYAGREGDEHVVFVTDGHTRLESAKLANNEGTEITTLPVVIKPQTTTKEDLTVALFQSNEGRPLNSWEKATVVKRLIGYGMEKAEIAKRLSMSDRMIDNYILMSGAPAKVRDMIVAGQVSGTEAVKALAKDPAKAADVLKAAIDAAKTAGKSKATGKDIEEAAEKAKRESGAAGSAQRDTTTTRTVRGKTVDSLKLAFKAGDEADADTIREVQKVAGGKWWEVLAGSDKKKVKIVSDITIELKVTTPAPEIEPDAGTSEGAGDQSTPETPAAEDPDKL